METAEFSWRRCSLAVVSSSIRARKCCTDDVEDVGARNLGRDLTCIHASGGIRRVEVKGVSRPTPSILLTRNEVRSAHEDENWELAVVTRALTNPTLAVYPASEVLEHAESFVYRVDL
ncbi:protein NO VEIN domain-containing protein [Rhodococcus sp. KBS0724]|uniref:protein NO VEIN domain-containing protein n=1 Tax=Rhodococcus sp. KBS0724 TaxID=1179674 RepID=UPI0037C69D2F